MVSISDFGIGFARPTAALAILGLSVAASAQLPATSDIQIEIAGLRDAHGLIRLCLIRDPKTFATCKGPDVFPATVKASVASIPYSFRAIPAGTYAVALFHDANGNGKLESQPKASHSRAIQRCMRVPRASTKYRSRATFDRLYYSK